MNFKGLLCTKGEDIFGSVTDYCLQGKIPGIVCKNKQTDNKNTLI